MWKIRERKSREDRDSGPRNGMRPRQVMGLALERVDFSRGVIRLEPR